ncbi:MAG: DNA polymerase III subunit epsilon, partial [Coriobacteriia bacterium]|nr:DNA polymerase III subunit epsilon [Coriobacteriia bacterium]
ARLSRLDYVASADDCLKHRCYYYKNCLLHGTRQMAAASDIVVTNQALLFCDVVADGGILPTVRHWVIDEAHGMESEARDQLSEALSARDLANILEALLSAHGLLAQLRDQAMPLAGSSLLVGRADACLAESAALPAISGSFFSELKELASLAESSGYDRVDLWIDQRIRATAPWGLLYSSGSALSRRLAELGKDCQTIAALANQFEELIDLQADLAGLTASLGRELYALNLVLNGDDPDYVYSAELDRRPERQSDSLLAARLDVGAELAERFYPQEMSVILTSATLAAGTSFDYFAHNVGLDRLPPASWRTLLLASSFDFDRQMAVYLPTDLPEPSQRGYAEALEELLFSVHQAMGGSVLTLFTNRREMERLYERLRPRLGDVGLDLRCQRSTAQSRHLAEDFLKDRELSLFALRSFWQGFDAPGETLRCVVIAKLPFSRPTEPLNRERSLREPDAWRRYALPEAVIELKQAAGRLIRSSEDSGALVLADTRLLSKGYGKVFINSLPSRQRYTLSIEQIAEQLLRSSARPTL